MSVQGLKEFLVVNPSGPPQKAVLLVEPDEPQQVKKEKQENQENQANKENQEKLQKTNDKILKSDSDQRPNNKEEIKDNNSRDNNKVIIDEKKIENAKEREKVKENEKDKSDRGSKEPNKQKLHQPQSSLPKTTNVGQAPNKPAINLNRPQDPGIPQAQIAAQQPLGQAEQPMQCIPIEADPNILATMQAQAVATANALGQSIQNLLQEAPAQLAQPEQPTQPIQPIQPTQPVQPVQPAQLMIQPAQHPTQQPTQPILSIPPSITLQQSVPDISAQIPTSTAPSLSARVNPATSPANDAIKAQNLPVQVSIAEVNPGIGQVENVNETYIRKGNKRNYIRRIWSVYDGH